MKPHLFRPTQTTLTTGPSKCVDCGKEFQPVAKLGEVGNCCEACHARRIESIGSRKGAKFGFVEPSLPETKTWYRSWIFWALAAAACVAAAVTVLSMPRARRYYDKWSARRAVGRAQEFFAQGDFRHALLDARRALEFKTRDVEAVRIIVKSLDAMGSPQAIEWRQRLNIVSPGEPENVLALAKADLKSGYLVGAGQRLEGLKPAVRDSAPFHALAAEIASQKRDLKTAELYWSLASKLDPKNDTSRLNLVFVLMQSTSPEARARALEILVEMSAKPESRQSAVLALLEDALARGDRQRAKELAQEMVSAPDVTISTRLRHLAILRAIEDPEAAVLLPRLKDEVLTRPEDLYQLFTWMNTQHLSLLVLEWLPGLPPDTAARPPVCVAVAEARSRALDWDKLAETMESASWGELDFLRHIYLARAYDHTDDEEGARVEWRAALAAAEKIPERLERLAAMSIEWRWPQRAEDALWKLSTNRRCPRWALDFLWGEAAKRGSAEQLREVGRQFVRAEPRNIVARNNFICLSLLTRSTDRDINDLAAGLYQDAPGNASAAATYGLSLLLQHREHEAVALMRTLEPARLREPGIAFYHGMFLMAARQADEALEYIEIGRRHPMLPEEKTLFDRITAAAAVKTVPSGKSAPPMEENPRSRPPL